MSTLYNVYLGTTVLITDSPGGRIMRSRSGDVINELISCLLTTTSGTNHHHHCVGHTLIQYIIHDVESVSRPGRERAIRDWPSGSLFTHDSIRPARQVITSSDPHEVQTWTLLSNTESIEMGIPSNVFITFYSAMTSAPAGTHT